MADRYPIPAGRVRYELVIGGSRFISTLDVTPTADAADAFIKEMREEFYDATHNVYAFRAGYGASITEGASDDGEPSGTAGRPALAVLRGEDIGDVAVVITRYFGGTKLGTGGLVRAYTQMTKEAIKAVTLAERIATRTTSLTVPYALYEQVKLLVTEHGGDIIDEQFGADVALTVRFAVDHIPGFEPAFQDLTAGKIKPDWQAG